jgi:hypothetical protein
MDAVSTKKRLSVSLSFKWFDFWVGWYFDKVSKVLYVCLLPMFPIRFYFETIRRCPECGHVMKKVAVMDEGWSLNWECPECGEILDIDWPYGESLVSSQQLEDSGFEIV